MAVGTCIRGHPHASTIVHMLAGGMKLSYKKITASKSIKWLLRYGPLKRVTTAGWPAAHTQKFPLIYERLCSLRSFRNNFCGKEQAVLTVLATPTENVLPCIKLQFMAFFSFFATNDGTWASVVRSRRRVITKSLLPK